MLFEINLMILAPRYYRDRVGAVHEPEIGDTLLLLLCICTHASSYSVLTAFQGSAPGFENVMNTPGLSLLHLTLQSILRIKSP